MSKNNSTSYNTASEHQPHKLSDDGINKSTKSSTSNKSVNSNTSKAVKTATNGTHELDNKEPVNGDNSGNKRSILKTIRNLFFKASLNLSLAKSKLRQFTEEALSSDEVVNELFLVTSSSSINSSLLEPEDTETTNNQSSNIQSETQTCPELPRFSEFDAVKEADKLRTENVPFDQGDKVWQKRREVWLNSTEEDRLKSKQRQLDGQFVTNLNNVGKENYAIIYNSLIEKSRTLKKPMNLKDAIKVINSGWMESRKWERVSQGLV